MLTGGGFVVSSRTDANNLTSTESRELKFEGKNVPAVTVSIGNSEFVCEFI